MKKVQLLLSLFVVVFYLSACRKTTNISEESMVLPAQTISTVKDWLIRESSAFNEQQRKFVDSLLNTASWNTAVQGLASNGKTIIYVPTRQPGVGLEVFYDSKSNQVDSGNIVKIDNRHPTNGETGFLRGTNLL